MGLSERKVKQRIGLDPRNLSWSDDKTRFSYKHMQALGWKENTGLGSSFEGNPNHIAVVRKADNGGIGMGRARKEGDDLAAGAGQAGQGLEEVLRRLAAASGSPSPSLVATPVNEEKPKEPAVVRNKIASRQRHLAAKRAAVQSPQALAEILGVPVSSLPSSAVTTPSPLASSSSTPQPEIKPEIKPDVKPTLADLESTSALKSERTSEDLVTTSKLSVSDYFRQKMREKMLVRQAATGGSPQVKVEDLPAHSLESMGEEEEKKPAAGSGWEGTKMTFEEQTQEFEPSDSTAAIPKEEDEKIKKKARKDAKRLAKLDKEKNKSKEHDPIHEAHQTLEAFEHAGEVVEEDKGAKKRQKEEKKRERDEKETKEKKKRKRDDDGDEKKGKKDRKSREGHKEKEKK
ncbi:Pin2-interacting protein X1 [Cryptococcus neoformans Tu259-1]|uniref:PinX1-related protein 1 n=1 Tax=Cryptococcus neoformans Tu259-1 TaxID=1230072 RepID=A0A854Q583_CRYNE|nr:Pin2-interacting protein X1 [Cryptococcus neoformans var. grubii AD1-83a]OWZ50452.1 Pin2-interacting protein X1 [Cryptococcus neoformans var. grubii 125.91]OXG11424.1 Pin2-interacting protein X1 [Cryptococcus neoformans var. grubii Tu259-1]OXG46870.1 Pin2-interacting protein X1 [Cryptococcus neoformans var. grubii MW-RSA1955]OXG50584.1 Pin2-interacting protein X1 [Cryptococcus neoformans var. grubii CHC193]OXG57453.1 Pin2-interacting protein X1 [Cryptococcus neoformans var. grubii c8]OXH02